MKLVKQFNLNLLISIQLSNKALIGLTNLNLANLISSNLISNKTIFGKRTLCLLFHSTLLFVQQFDACVCVCQYTTIMAWQHKDKTTNMALRMQNRPNLNSKSMVVMQSCAVVKTLVFPITSIIYFRLIRKRNRLYRITKHLTCITRHLRDHMTSNKNMSRDLTRYSDF